MTTPTSPTVSIRLFTIKEAAEVLKIAIDRKVAFVPGAAFHPTGGGKNTMRLNFSYPSPETIRQGISRLGITLKELIADK